jgi:glucose-6-phosphate-specific signal transduction histidine kinase
LEAAWVLWRVRARRTLRDPVLIGTDLATCLCLIAVSMAAQRALQGQALTGVMPFLLAGTGIVACGLGWSWRGALAVGTLATAWATALPVDGLRTLVGLSSLGLSYAITITVAREFRGSADLIEAAVRIRDEAADWVREADLARERELAYREIHGHLLPIVDAVAKGADCSGSWAALAVREAARARRLIVAGQAEHGPGFAALLTDVSDTFAGADMALTPVLRIAADPPAEIGQVLADAAREALTNVLKHAGARCEVHLYAESSGERAEVVVRDRGHGFDLGTVLPGSGFGRTYEAVRRRGGAVEIWSSQRAGTRVRILWPAGVRASGAAISARSRS